MKSGSVLAGRYRLIAPLGRGGMGSVWHAEHLGLKAPVAIKLLSPELDGRLDSIARFLREAQSAASLRSPHVVQVFDHGLDEPTQTPFIAMELMEGESLAERLDRVGKLSPAETAKLITQAARALSRAQEQGIVHRDLKPANLFLVRNEDDEQLKVLDFGLVKWRRPLGALTQGVETATDLVMGTPYYMSPEQMTGTRDADHRSDLWALGVIAFECLTGTRPYDGDNLISIALKVLGGPTPRLPASLALPSALDPWFERALAKEPEQRFQSARELAEELRRACGVGASSVTSLPQEPSAVAHRSLAANSVDAAHAAGRTVPLSRVPLAEPSAESAGPAMQSAEPLARSIEAPPEPRASSRRRLAWALAAGIVLAGLAALFSTTRTGAPTVASNAPAVPSSAPLPLVPALPSSTPPAETTASAASLPPLPAESASAVAPPIAAPPIASTAPTISAQEATQPAKARTPLPREPRRAPANRGAPIDIERVPTF